MPDSEAWARKRGIEACGLTILEKEIFRPNCSFCPESVALGLFSFQSIELQRFFSGNHHLRFDPTEFRETPTRHTRGTISLVFPRSTCHKAPITDSMRAIRRVVEVRQSTSVTEFMGKNADAPVFRFGGIGK